MALVYVLWQLYSDGGEGDLPSILLITMIVLILFPLFVDYCGSFRNTTKKQKMDLLSFFPIFPIFSLGSTFSLNCKKASLNYNIDGLTMPSGPSVNLLQKMIESSDKLEKTVEEEEDVNAQIIQKRLLETTVEAQHQAYVKIILVLLYISKTKIATGVEALFVNLEFFGIPSNVLILFTMFPIFKHCRLYLNTVDRALTAKGQLVLVSFVFFCLLAKATSIVSVFTFPLGLFSSLGHWQEQQKPFTCTAMFPPRGDGFYHGVDRSGELIKKPWSSIGGNICQKGPKEFFDIRTNQTVADWQPESAPFYNSFDLTSTCIAVLCLGVFRLLAIYTAKYLFSEEFRNETFSSRIEHILHNNIGACPVTFTVWENATTFPEIWKKYNQEWNEMLALIVIDFVENILLLVPLTLTFRNMAEHHALLLDTIGVRDIEVTSYKNCLFLMIFSYSIVTSSLVFKIVLYNVYNNHAHLWKTLLAEARKIWKERKYNEKNFGKEEIQLTAHVKQDFDESEDGKKTKVERTQVKRLFTKLDDDDKYFC